MSLYGIPGSARNFARTKQSNVVVHWAFYDSPALLSVCENAQVPPGATVQLLHSLVLEHKVGRLARSSASTLQLHFTLDAGQRAAQPPRQVDCPWERPNLAPDQLPHPPALPQVLPQSELLSCCLSLD